MTHPRRTHRIPLFALVATALLLFATPASSISATVAPPPVTEPATDVSTTDANTTDVSTTDVATPDTVNDFLDLERDVTQCISSNPLPGCGREPTSSGDRGGWQQLLLFGILIVGLGIVFGRVFVAVRRGDKRL